MKEPPIGKNKRWGKVGGAGDFCRQDRAAIKHSIAPSKGLSNIWTHWIEFCCAASSGMLAQVWLFTKPSESPMAS